MSFGDASSRSDVRHALSLSLLGGRSRRVWIGTASKGWSMTVFLPAPAISYFGTTD